MSQTIKITYKTGEDSKHFYVLQAPSWTSLMQSVESNIKDEEINKLRKFWIGECFIFLSFVFV